MEQLKAFLDGKTHSSFATKAGISPAYLSQILRGKRTPSLAVITRIHKVTNDLVAVGDWVGSDSQSEPVA